MPCKTDIKSHHSFHTLQFQLLLCSNAYLPANTSTDRAILQAIRNMSVRFFILNGGKAKRKSWSSHFALAKYDWAHTWHAGDVEEVALCMGGTQLNKRRFWLGTSSVHNRPLHVESKSRLSIRVHPCSASKKKNKNNKYQGVKEFHMLARISCYWKITVFSPFELGNIIVNHPKVTNEVALSNI